MKKITKIFVVILAISLLCGALAFAIGAENKNVAEFDGEQYATLEEAINAAEDAELAEGETRTVRLTADYLAESAIIVSKDMTIDLGGYTLSSADSSLFTLNLGCEVNVVGTGVIEIPGALVYSATTVNKPVFNITGDAGTNGIKILHTGAIGMNVPTVASSKISSGSCSAIVNVVQGSYSFKNVNIISTVDAVNDMCDWSSLFYTRYDSLEGAHFFFDTVNLIGPDRLNNSTKAVFNVEGKGTVTVKNSFIRAALNSFRTVGATAERAEDTIVYVENSEIYAEGTMTKDGSRLYFVEAMPGIEAPSNVWDATGEGSYMRGRVYVKNSTIGAAVRVFLGGNDVENIALNGSVVLDNTTVKNFGNIGTDSNYMMTRNMPIHTMNGVRFQFNGTSLGTEGVLNAAVGTRFNNNIALTKEVDGEDGGKVTVARIVTPENCSLVYDPAGDAAYPWVVVANDTTIENAVPQADFYAEYNMECLHPTFSTSTQKKIIKKDADGNIISTTHDPAKSDGSAYTKEEYIALRIPTRVFYYTKTNSSESKPDANGIITVTENTVYHYEFETTTPNTGDRVLLKTENQGMGAIAYAGGVNTDQEWNCKRGTIFSVTDGENRYLQYCVTPLDDAPDAETRNFNAENSSNADPYFVLGSKHEQSASNLHLFDSGDTKRPTRKVMVAEIDFGTDSDKGFTGFNIGVQTRTGGSTGGGSQEMFGINAAGVVSNKLYDSFSGTEFVGTKGNDDINTTITNALTPLGEWNRLSVVVYVNGETVDGGVTYVYINGEYVGCCLLYDTAKVNTKDLKKAATFRGFRVSINKSENQKVGSTLCFDNVSMRAYNEYMEGESYATPAHASYITKAPVLQYVGSVASVAGRDFNSLPAAIEAAEAQGSAVTLNRDVATPVEIKKNITIYTNGYSLALTEGSWRGNPNYLNGEIVSYTFKESNNQTLDYYWYVNDDLTMLNNLMDPTNTEVTNLTFPWNDPAYVVKTQVKIGETPVAPKEFTSIYTEKEYGVIERQTGWFDTNNGTVTEGMEISPLTLDYYNAYKVVGAFYAPALGVDDSLTSYVRNNGAIESVQASNTESYTAYTQLNSGDTLVLLKDLNLNGTKTFNFTYMVSESGGVKTVNGVTIDGDYTDEEIAKMKEKAVKIAVDLNGNSILNLKSGYNIAVIKSNVDISFYSSKPGATIEGYNYNTSENKIRAQRLFCAFGDAETVEGRKSAYNAYLSIGKFVKDDGTVVPGSNLTLSGSVLLEGRSGDNSVFMTMDGVLGIKSVEESKGAILTRCFDGTITIKNSTIICPRTTSEKDSQIINMLSYYTSGNKPSDMNDPLSGRNSGFENYTFSPLVYVENSTLINQGAHSSGAKGGIVGNNGDGTGVCLVFNNVVTNGRVNPSNIGNYRVRVFGGVIGDIFACNSDTYYIDSDDAALCEQLGVDLPTSDIVTAKKNQAMTIPSEFLTTEDYIEVKVPTGKDSAGNFTYQSYFYANAGYTGEGFALNDSSNRATNKKVILPYLESGTAYQSDIVTVTFKGLGTNADKTVNYIKGGNVDAADLPTPKAYDGNLFTLTPDGTWGALPTNVQENVTITPGYTVSSKITGVKTNVVLSDNIGVGIYIPSNYSTNITVFDGETQLPTETVTVGSESYVKATIYRVANQLEKNVVFTLKVNDGNEEIILTESFSIAAYAKTILDDTANTYTAKDKKLVYAVVDYVNEAVKYVKGAANLALSAIVSDDAYAAYKDANVYDYENALDRVSFGAAVVGASVRITADPKFVFVLADDFVGTVKATAGASEETFTVTAESPRFIEVGLLSANSFETNVTLEITVEGAEPVIGEYNLDTFVKYHADNAANREESAKSLGVIEAFYRYVKSASAYVTPDVAPEPDTEAGEGTDTETGEETPNP